MSMREALNEVFIPEVEGLIAKLDEFATEWKDIAMLAKTHGQPASPTRLGKEIKVFVSRLQVQLAELKTMKMPAKFGGATGNFNAHNVAFPAIDWIAFGNKFTAEKLGVERQFEPRIRQHQENQRDHDRPLP